MRSEITQSQNAVLQRRHIYDAGPPSHVYILMWRRCQLTSCFVLGLCWSLTFTGPVKARAQTKEPANSATIVASAPYKIEDLGELTTIAADVTASLNNSGTVAYWTRSNGTIHATLWRQGAAIMIEGVPGHPNTIAHAINLHGNIGGWTNTSKNLVDSLSTTQGFVRIGNRTVVVPGLGGRDSRVFGLNDKDTAVGESTLADGASHAFMIDGSTITDLGTLPLGKSSTAYAINNSGVIAGVADVDGKVNHAVIWTDRKILDLGTLPRGAVSSARSINNRGQIAGFSDTPDGIHAFLYADGAMQDLGTLGSDPSEASGINNRGEVVGASNVTGTQRHAFLWQNGRMADLNTLLPKGSNWTLRNAFSINDQGQITCSALRNGETAHLLLLTPQ